MPDIKQGDKVKVTYEAEFFADLGEMVQLKVGETYLYAPKGATIEAIRPEVKEPTAFGALVEVGVLRATRSDDSVDAWYGNDEDWYSWAELQEKGEIKIMFDPDKPPVVEEAHPALKDADGDVWHWEVAGENGPGYYYYLKDDGLTETWYEPSREAVAASHGPVQEV